MPSGIPTTTLGISANKTFSLSAVGFGFSRVLIDLKLVQSPWAYSVMAVTILIDIYLLFIFFTVQQAASRRSQRYGLC